MVLEGVLDAGRLRTAAQALLLRHANLRAPSVHHEGLERPVQVIPARSSCRGGRSTCWRCRIRPSRHVATNCWRPTGPSGSCRRLGLPLRWTLLKLSPERYVLVLTNHHILLDGWSKSILLGELWTLYANGGDTDALPRVRPYADYLAWLAAQDSAAALAAWRDYLAGLDGATRLAPPRARTGSRAMPERWQTDLPVGLTARLHGLARQRGLTQSTVVQGLWAVLLGRLTGRDDVVFGVTVSGRPAELAGVEQMVGLFINTVPAPGAAPSRRPAGNSTGRNSAEPGATAGPPARGARGDPAGGGNRRAVRHAGGLRELPCGPSGTGRVFRRPASCRGLRSRCGALSAEPGGGARRAAAPASGLRPGAIHAGDGRIDRRAIGDDCSRRRWRRRGPLHRLEVLDAHERRTAAGGVQRHGAVRCPRQPCRELFETQAARTPHAVALSFEGQELTYGELNARANRLAHHLIGLGVGPECLVGIALERSTEMVVAVLAIAQGRRRLPAARPGLSRRRGWPTCWPTPRRAWSSPPRPSAGGCRRVPRCWP